MAEGLLRCAGTRTTRVDTLFDYGYGSGRDAAAAVMDDDTEQVEGLIDRSGCV